MPDNLCIDRQEQRINSGNDTDIEQPVSPSESSPFTPPQADPLSPIGSARSYLSRTVSLPNSLDQLPNPPNRLRFIYGVPEGARRSLPLLNVEIPRGGNEINQAAAAAGLGAAGQVDAHAEGNQAAAASRIRFIAKHVGDLWSNYEACFIFLICCLLLTPLYQFFIFEFEWAISPEIEFNLDRARCIFVKTNRTFPRNCIRGRKARFLNQTIVKSYCRKSLKNAFEYECKNSKSKTADNLPIIERQSFMNELAAMLEKYPIDKATSEDLFNVCVQVFKNNPFGDVEVRRVNLQNQTNRYVFVYRNQRLLRSVCEMSPPPGSRAFAGVPLFYNNRQTFLLFAGVVILVSSFFAVCCTIVFRSTSCERRPRELPGLPRVEQHPQPQPNLQLREIER